MKLIYPRREELGGKIIDRYSPDGFSAVYIVEREGIKHYVLRDPEVKKEELKFINDIIENRLVYIARPSDVKNEAVMKGLLKRVGIVDDKLIYLVIREVVGYKALHPLIMDENLEDILCTGAGIPIIVLHQSYGRMDTNIVLNKEEADEIVRMLAYKGGKTISRFVAKLDSVILPTGDRARLVYRSEVSPSSNFTIRKFPRNPWTPPMMLATGMITESAMAWLWLAIEHKMPVIIFGEMGSGKSSLQNSLGMLIRPTSSIAIISDVPELKIPHPIKYEFYVRSSESIERIGEISMEDLIAHALRASVDYLLINEVRFKEAKAFAQAVATGHAGITTFHASDLKTLFGRLKDLGVEHGIASSLKIFIRTAVFIAKRGDRTVRIRRVREISYLKGLKDWSPLTESLFKYNIADDTLVDMGVKNSLFLEELSRISYLSKENLLGEHKIMSELLSLVRDSFLRDKGIGSTKGWFELLKKFCANERGVVERLRGIAKPVPERGKVVVLVSEEDLERLRRSGVKFRLAES